MALLLNTDFCEFNAKEDRFYRYIYKNLAYIQLLIKPQKINLEDQSWNK